MNDKNIYEEHKLKDGHILQIFQDTWAESPRSWSNLGTMAIFHTRYNFGDEVNFSSDDFGNWSEMEEHIENELKASVCIPIYLYDHSGITINTEGFSCPWDSGQVGFIYVTDEKLAAVYIDKLFSIITTKVSAVDLLTNYFNFAESRDKIQLKYKVTHRECIILRMITSAYHDGHRFTVSDVM